MRCMGVHVCVVRQDNKSVAFFLRNVYIVFHFTIMIIMKSRSFHALWLQQNSHHLAEIFKWIFLKWKLLYLDINVNEGCHYGNQSRGYLIGGRPLWPPAVPRLAARSSQSNPRGSGPEVLKRQRGHVTAETGVAEVGVFRALQPNVSVVQLMIIQHWFR